MVADAEADADKAEALREKQEKAQEEANKRAEERRRKEKEDKLRNEKEYNDAVIKARKELEDEITRIGEAARDKRNKEQEDRKEAAKKADQDIYDNAKGYLEAAILDNANNFQAKIDLLDVQKAELLQNKELTEGEIAAIEAKYRKDREQLDKEEDEKKQKRIAQQVQGVQDSLSIISNLTELFAGKSRKQQERAFKIQKAVNIASAVIDTYKAANAALASAPVPFNFIAMGAAITAGLVNVKKIASQQFQGGGASSGGGSFSGGGSSSGGAMGGSSTVITPNFNIVGNNGQNQLGNLAPVQAFVVSSEMTSQQQLDRNRLRNATF